MKLSSLFEYQFPEITYRKVNKFPNRRRRTYSDRSPDVKMLGQATFATAYTNKNRPEDVRKISRLLGANNFLPVDGYYYYLKALADNPDNGNPYYPRFRNITIYEDDNGKVVYSASMERLFSLDTLTKREIDSILDRILGTDSVARREYAFQSLSSIISSKVRYRKDIIEDVDLKNAALFIRSVAEKHKLMFDLHAGNIMIRRTPYGAQLVITDPLSFKE